MYIVLLENIKISVGLVTYTTLQQYAATVTLCNVLCEGKLQRHQQIRIPIIRLERTGIE